MIKDSLEIIDKGTTKIAIETVKTSKKFTKNKKDAEALAEEIFAISSESFEIGLAAAKALLK